MKRTASAVIHFILILVAVSSTYAAEWKTIKLSGTFRGVIGDHVVSGYTKCRGDHQYSLTVNNIVASQGDIVALLLFTDPPVLRLKGGYVLDLGVRAQPPTGIKLPSDFSSNKFSYEPSDTRFLKGHYYYMVTLKNAHVVFQIEDMDIGPQQKTKFVTGFFSKPIGEAVASITLRLLYSTKSLDELNAILSGTPIRAAINQQSKILSGKSLNSQPVRNTPTSIEPLLTEYESFQKSTSAFLDLPLDQVSVVKCDQLIDSGTAVKSKVGQEITSLHEQIREGTADVEKYKDRIERVSNLQLKDRVTTKINQLEANNQERRVKLKQWKARQNELDTSLRTLREYRDILK